MEIIIRIRIEVNDSQLSIRHGERGVQLDGLKQQISATSCTIALVHFFDRPGIQAQSLQGTGADVVQILIGPDRLDGFTDFFPQAVGKSINCAKYISVVLGILAHRRQLHPISRRNKAGRQDKTSSYRANFSCYHCFCAFTCCDLHRRIQVDASILRSTHSVEDLDDVRSRHEMNHGRLSQINSQGFSHRFCEHFIARSVFELCNDQFGVFFDNSGSHKRGSRSDPHYSQEHERR